MCLLVVRIVDRLGRSVGMMQPIVAMKMATVVEAAAGTVVDPYLLDLKF